MNTRMTSWNTITPMFTTSTTPTLTRDLSASRIHTGIDTNRCGTSTRIIPISIIAIAMADLPEPGPLAGSRHAAPQPSASFNGRTSPLTVLERPDPPF